MQKEWINIDLNVIGIIKQLLTLFLGYMMFGKCRVCIVHPSLLMLPSSFTLGLTTHPWQFQNIMYPLKQSTTDN